MKNEPVSEGMSRYLLKIARQASSFTELMRPWRAAQADILARIAGHPAQKLDELMPWSWRKKNSVHDARAAYRTPPAVLSGGVQSEGGTARHSRARLRARMGVASKPEQSVAAIAML